MGRYRGLGRRRRRRRYNSGGCFIATATMGDYNHPTVLQLRDFRDEYLLTRGWGKAFVKTYYAVSPIFAAIISKSIVLRKVSYALIVKPLSIIAKRL